MSAGVSPPRLLLASASPRRRELLTALGLPFVVNASEVDESVPAGAGPGEAALAIAGRKATAMTVGAASGLVLTADTVVALDNRILGKPRDAAEARDMLVALKGRAHSVYTGVMLASAGGPSASQAGRVIHTAVLMRSYTGAEIAASIAAGTPFDKAGGYAIQDTDLHPVERCDGCYCNVMGLPLWTVYALLHQRLPGARLLTPDGTYDRCAACPLRQARC